MAKIKNIANVRDLGGIQMADGRKIIPGRLIRGGHLNKIKDKDLSKVKDDLGITRVIDLRSPSEKEEKPDKLPEGVAYTYLPSLTNEQNPAINRKNRTSELKRIMRSEGGAIGYLSGLYRTLITQEMSIESHKGLINTLLDTKEGAVYLHCTQGKDRTGVASAVILMALGASREEIIKDYLNEKKSLKVKNEIITSLVGVVMFNRKAKLNLSVLMNAKVQCIEAALDEIEVKFGSFERYIKDVLDISDTQLSQLQKMYLSN